MRFSHVGKAWSGETVLTMFLPLALASYIQMPGLHQRDPKVESLQQENGRFLGILAILMLQIEVSGTRAAVCPISSALHVTQGVTHLLGTPVGLLKDCTRKVLHNRAAGIWWARDLNSGLGLET